MKAKLIIIPALIIIIAGIFITAVMLNNQVAKKLFYKPNDYIFLLRVSPNEHEDHSPLQSYLVETDRQFKVIAKQKTDSQYTSLVYQHQKQTIKLYSYDTKKTTCLNIKTQEKKPCMMTKADLDQIDKLDIGLYSRGMLLRDNNVGLMIEPEITFMSQNHHFFVVSGLQLK